MAVTTSQADSSLDLSTVLKSGDRILVAQGAGEPIQLTSLLVQQRDQLDSVGVTLGLTLSPTIYPEHTDHLKVTVFGGMGYNKVLTSANCADVLPVQLSHLPDLIRRGIVAVDVLFIQVTPEDNDGFHSLGVTADFLQAAAEHARVVIAEVNDRMPWTFGNSLIAASSIDHKIYTSRLLPVVAGSELGDIERAVADHVADLIPDRSVLQVGIGKLPDAIMRTLGDRSDLGIHSGLVGDSLLDLIESGVVTNAHKPFDTGITVTGTLMGSQRLYDWAHRNPRLSMQPVSYTHAGSILSQIPTFTSINSAISVDLTGQINAESLSGNYIGAVGGQVDFVRAGTAAPLGRSIIALPASAMAGKRSRIVARLEDNEVTTLRTDVDVIVTEYGVAELKGRTLAERARRMIGVAAPNHREELDRAAWTLSRDSHTR